MLIRSRGELFFRGSIRLAGGMAKLDLDPQFEPEMIKSGRWFVSVKTGNGPDSHIGDFATEAEAKEWISAKSRYWPGKPDKQTKVT
jgi:hypothetical protein